MSVFQERLSTIMHERNLKAIDISKGTGISTSTISKYLSDVNKEPLFDYVCKISEFLDIDIKWLGGYSDNGEIAPMTEFSSIYNKLTDEEKKQVNQFIGYIYEIEGM